MELVLCTVYMLVFILLILRWRFFRSTGIPSLLRIFIFLVKFGFALMLWYVYTYYYPNREDADIYKYFDDSKVLFDSVWRSPLDFLKMLSGIGCGGQYFREHYFDVMNHWYRPQESGLFNDNRTIIRIHALLRCFSFGYFQVHNVVFCFFSFTGLVAVYKTFQPYFEHKRLLLLVSVFFIPSVLFWSSGVLKEALLFLAIGGLLRSWMMFSRGNRRGFRLPVFILSLCLMLLLKVYVLACLLPGMFAWYWVEKSNFRNMFVKYSFVFISCTLLAWNIRYVAPAYHLPEILVKKQKWFLGLARHSHAGSAFHMDVLEAAPGSFIKAFPEAFVNAFFRPFIWEKNEKLSLAASVENIMILLCLGLFAYCSGGMDKKKWNLFMFLISYVLLLYLLIGWVTPVTGAIVRYRVPGIPFLCMAFLLMADHKKINPGIWQKRWLSLEPHRA